METVVNPSVIDFLQLVSDNMSALDAQLIVNNKLFKDHTYTQKVDTRCNKIILDHYATDIYSMLYTFCKMFWLPGANQEIHLKTLQSLFDALATKNSFTYRLPKVQINIAATFPPELNKGLGNVLYFAILDIIKVSKILFSNFHISGKNLNTLHRYTHLTISVNRNVVLQSSIQKCSIFPERSKMH